MKYKIVIKKKVEKNLRKLPGPIREKFLALAEDLIMTGPTQTGWPNYSKLVDNEYHCHLSYSWVACWRHEKNTIIIEVYYVGSREKAPY